MRNENVMTKEEAIESLTEAGCDMQNFRIRRYLASFEKIVASLKFPDHPNWSYCLPLAGNVTIKGETYDLGLCLRGSGMRKSANIVFSNDGPDYLSGDNWLSSRYKQLALIAVDYGIMSMKDVADTFLEENGLFEKFMRSDKDYYDLKDWIIENK